MSAAVGRSLVAVAAVSLLLVGCGGPENTDPRYGRVVIDEESCLTGDCYVIWKVCMGPDLLIHNTQADDDNQERLVEGHPDCEGWDS